jgi:formylglycine-generating enzyme required for sulfatase activity
MAASATLPRELHQARYFTDQLFGVIRGDSFYERPIPERHRIIFYLGHLEAFDWNLMAREMLHLPSFHPSFDHLFAFGIDPAEGHLPDDQPADWPTVAEVEDYNRQVRDRLDQVWERVPPAMLEAAIEHRLMHAETLAYIFHQLPYERKLAPPPAAEPMKRDFQPRMVEIPAGCADLGLPRDAGFGWDNEYEHHRVAVPAFSIGRHKVTNGEYLEFVRDGGPVPFFWTERNGAWFYRGMFAETPLPLDAPVYVTLRQAEQYAAWRGMMLPTEEQFHRAAVGRPASCNTDFRYWDPVAVTADESAEGGPQQMTGNGWEWTSTVFGPFPGFEPFSFYRNYSAPFFDGAHYVLKGGSPRTAARLLRPSFRNWFRPSYPYIYATFRLVQS